MKDKLAFGVRCTASGLLLTLCALLMLIFALLTGFQSRRRYTDVLLVPCARGMLRIWGLRMVVHHDAPFSAVQTVYVMNHTASIDVFVIVALALPNTRFFLSGFLRQLPPLALIGYLIGIFWTVDQRWRERRVQIFQRACRILQSTGESVCLSPEGERITTGKIGPFNKGAFHLAAALRAPMQPIFIHIPPSINTGKSWYARPGTLHVYIGSPLDTSSWQISDVAHIKEEVRQYYVRWKERLHA